LTPSPLPDPTAVLRAAAERRAIDASCRRPVLTYLASATAWLVVGSLLALVASIKMHLPEWLGQTSWLTFGRVRPAHLNTVVYGWGSMAAIGTAVWMMCRLARVELKYGRFLTAAAWLWNVGIGVGTVGLLAGYSQSIEWLEFPRAAPPILALSLGTAAAVVIVTFLRRRETHVYVTQWYVIGAFFWMPILYVTAVLLTAA